MDYTYDGDEFLIEGKKNLDTLYDIGSVIKKFRKSQGMSQKELSKLVGVTPSNISQIESNQVFPSIPALYKIADQLSVDVGSFFREKTFFEKTIFHPADGIKINVLNGNKKRIEITQITPFDLDVKVELFIIKISPEGKLSSHFFQHKGEEIGYLLSGEIKMVYQDQTHHLHANDTIYLKTSSPTQWHNTKKDPVSFLWSKVK